MTIGEQLLNLTVEYQNAVDPHSEAPAGREPQEIAADYEAVVRSLLKP